MPRAREARRAARVSAVASLAVLVALPVAAQDGWRGGETTFIDAIGPRREADVRRFLDRQLSTVEPCADVEPTRGRIGFGIAPDGRVLEPRPLDDPGADDATSRCVVQDAARWRFPPLRGRRAGHTAVSWGFRLHALPSRE